MPAVITAPPGRIPANYDPNLVPGNLPGAVKVAPAGTILAEQMVYELMNKLSPERFKELSEDVPGDDARYEAYKTTYDFCVNEFGEKYSDDIREVMDSLDSKVITIVKSGNGVGKSHAAARIGVAFYKRYKQSQVYTAAAPPESNLDIILWGQLRSLIKSHPEIFKGDHVASGKLISRKDDPLSFVIGLPIPQSADSHNRKARFSGKHAPHLLFILDEGDAIPNDIYEAIESCMSGGHCRLIVFFNPRANTGPLAKMEKNGTGHIVQVGAFTHPNVVTGQNLFDGAVDRETTVRRIQEWTTPLRDGEEKDKECFEVPPYLVGYVAKSHGGIAYPPLKGGWRRITEPQFAYMVLAEYPAVSKNQLISAAHIDNAVERWKAHVSYLGSQLSTSIRPVVGFDVAEYGVDKSVAFLKYGSYVAKPKVWGHSDPVESAEKLYAIIKNNRAIYANVDANGVGAGVAPYIQRVFGYDDIYGLKVQSRPEMEAFSPEQAELGEFKLLRDYILWSLREFLKSDPKAMIPDDPVLIDDLLELTYEVKGANIIVMSSDEFRERKGRSMDFAFALALACTPRFENISPALTVDNYINDGSIGNRARIHRGNFIGTRGRSSR